MSLADMFEAVSSFGVQSIAASGQEKAAQLAYRTFRKTKMGQKHPDWIDMTQREQGEWIAAMGDVIDEETK